MTKSKANEWADMATNGIQWLRNIRDGIFTPDAALQEMESNLARIRRLHPPTLGPAPGIVLTGPAEAYKDIQPNGPPDSASGSGQ